LAARQPVQCWAGLLREWDQAALRLRLWSLSVARAAALRLADGWQEAKRAAPRLRE